VSGTGRRPTARRTRSINGDALPSGTVDGVAVASIIASGVVGLAGVVGPVVVRRGDRKHERRTYVRDRRAETYRIALRLLVPSYIFGIDPNSEQMHNLAAEMWLWGSEPVRRLFEQWLLISHEQYGPDVTPEAKARVTSAANAVRLQMAAEVQGESSRWRSRRIPERREAPTVATSGNAEEARG
jgi:hypothetical protein